MSYILYAHNTNDDFRAIYFRITKIETEFQFKRRIPLVDSVLLVESLHVDSLHSMISGVCMTSLVLKFAI